MTLQTRIRTARVTGAWYLGVAVTGLVGFLLIRPQLFAVGDPAATLTHLVEQESLARIAIAVEMALFLTQTMAALWFYRLFRSVDAFLAGCIAVFGLLNAIAVVSSAAFLATGLQVALDPTLAPAADGAGTAQLMYAVSGNMWTVGQLSYGLWLIPMGQLVLRSRWMPPVLGWILIAGGAGYVLSAFLDYLAPGGGLISSILTMQAGSTVIVVPPIVILIIPAIVGQFWMIGYLVSIGVRRQVAATAPAS